MKRITALFILLLTISTGTAAQDILIPMDARQSNHLKAYGVTFWALTKGINTDWLLNYRGGSFLMPAFEGLEQELRIRGVYYESLNGA